MVGIATDGASVMVGKNHSVFTLLKQKQPSLQLIRCICHSLDIVAHKAMQLLPSNLDFMIRETYNWFAHPAKNARVTITGACLCSPGPMFPGSYVPLFV
ncbi:unnamed protein product [Arctogadus glacialis]